MAVWVAVAWLLNVERVGYWGRLSDGGWVSVGAVAASLGWGSVAGGELSVALVEEGWEGSCCPCLRSVLCSAVVVVESSGEAGEVGSGWEGLTVLSGDGGSARGAKAGVEASGEVDVWSLREAGVCVSSAVVLGASAVAVTTYGSVLLVAGAEEERSRTSWICWEARSSDQRIS